MILINISIPNDKLSSLTVWFPAVHYLFISKTLLLHFLSYDHFRPLIYHSFTLWLEITGFIGFVESMNAADYLVKGQSG